MTNLTTNNVQNIDLIKGLLVKLYPLTPIENALALSQAILESNLRPNQAPSLLAHRYNNLFGIKARPNEENTIQSVNLGTWEYINGEDIKQDAWFRKFNSVEDCIRRHKEILRLDRYAPVRHAKTFEEAANFIRLCGYATDPNYSKSLIAVYNQYVKNK